MGRAGLEPATLGLKVQPHKARRTVATRNVLHLPRVIAARTRTQSQRLETSLYVILYVMRVNNIDTVLRRFRTPGADARREAEAASGPGLGERRNKGQILFGPGPGGPVYLPWWDARERGGRLQAQRTRPASQARSRRRLTRLTRHSRPA